MEELALAYVARFATTAAKLQRYLQRKLRERGWDTDAEEADIAAEISVLVQRFVDRGFVDDAAFARARASDLLRRGYGARRVNEVLGQAGVAQGVRAKLAPGDSARREAAARLARRRRFGPYAGEPIAPDRREKQIAAMLRAGHSFDAARAVLDAPDEAAVDQWIAEAEAQAEDGDEDPYI